MASFYNSNWLCK